MTFAQRLLALYDNDDIRLEMDIVGYKYNDEKEERDPLVIVRSSGESVTYRVQGDKFRFDAE